MQAGQRLLVAQKRRLCRQYVDVGVNTRLVAHHLQVDKPLRRVGRRLLLHDLLRQNAFRRKKVLYLLESGQHRKAIGREIAVVNLDKLVHRGATQTRVEDGLRYRASDRPEAATDVQQMLEA